MRYRKPDTLSAGIAPVFNPVELAAPEDLRALQEKRLRDQVEYLVQNSRFYQKKFAEAGIDPSGVKKIEDLRCVPFTRKQDLRDSLARQRPLGETIPVQHYRLLLQLPRAKPFARLLTKNRPPLCHGNCCSAT